MLSMISGFLGISPVTVIFVVPIVGNAVVLLGTLGVWAIHDYFYRGNDGRINRRTDAYACSLPVSVRCSVFTFVRTLNDTEIEDLYTVPSAWTCLKFFTLSSIPVLSQWAFLVFGSLLAYTVAKTTLLVISRLISRKFREILQAPLF